MQDILGESLRKLRKIRVRKTRMIAILLVLSLVVSLDVFWRLRQPGLTLAGDADCGVVEHTHDEGCQNGETTCNLIEHVHEVSCYEATLNNNAVIGANGNPNEVYLEFSNNPYDDGIGKTETDKVTVFTYKLVINKTDSHGHALEGAGFTLYKKDIHGTYTALGTELKGEGMTTFTWTGLDDGDYKLEESTVPAGYNKMSDVVFSISAEHSEVAGVSTLALLDGGLMGEGVPATGIIEKDIVNNTGTVLPETGAEGTFLLIFGGSLLVILAAVFMITRKKMSVYEG